LILVPGWLEQGWMHVKLAFVVLLFAYHIKNHFIFKQFQKDDIRWTSNGMRFWNEGATLILFAIVFLVILKSAINWIWGLIGLIGLGIVLMLGIKLYKRLRNRKSSS
jgi:putative membrane protein